MHMHCFVNANALSSESPEHHWEARFGLPANLETGGQYASVSVCISFRIFRFCFQ
jgi:hypothetical protein